MLKNNADEEFIKKVTKISNQELKEIKLAMQQEKTKNNLKNR